MGRKPKREVKFDGQFYRVKSDRIEIPDLMAMDRFIAIRWLIQHTYARGYSKPNPLAGMAGAITILGQ